MAPLFADTSAVVEQFFRTLSAVVRGEPIYLDVPEPKADAMALAARHGMREAFGAARMNSRSVPALPQGRTYAITTFEPGYYEKAIPTRLSPVDAGPLGGPRRRAM